MNAINMAPIGRTVSSISRCRGDKSSDTLKTHTSEVTDEILCNSSYTLSIYEDVAYMGDFVDKDFVDTGFDSDTGSGAESG